MMTTPPTNVDQLDEWLTRPSPEVIAAVEPIEGDFVILGAGGKMGYHVTRMLNRALQACQRDNPITVVSRFSDPATRDRFDQLGVGVASADLSDPEQVDSLARAANVIFLAGIKFGTSDQPDLLQRMNVAMPNLVAQHFSDSRIVALSTGCVYSFTTPESKGSTEQSETDPPGEYAQSCLLRERAFVDGSNQHGTPCVLVRLNYSIDLRYGVLVDIAQRVQAGSPIDLQSGYVNVIWQGDAVAQILRCLPLTQSPPLILNITGTETLRVRDLAEMFGRQFGRPPVLTGSEQPTCWLSNSARAQRLFGQPSVSVTQMVEWIAEWLKAGGETLGKPTQYQARDGNY